MSSDEVIVKKVQAGDEHAFRLLIEKYRNYLYKTVYSIVRDEKEAEDVAQEVFIRIYYSLPNYESQGLKTWMTRIAVNHSIDWKRKVRRGNLDSIQPIDDQVVATEKKNIEAMIVEKELKLFVMKRINELPSNYRDVIFAFYIEEKTYHEIAIEHKVEVKTIETKLYRARKWIRKHWREEEFT